MLVYCRSDPEEIKQQLNELIDAEEHGMLTASMRQQKKNLQQAYDQALKRKMVKAAVPFFPCVK